MGGDERAQAPRPRRSPPGRALTYDFPGLLVGTAEYTDGPTGCTVLHLPRGARTAIDARGGSVGLTGGYPVNHAVCLAGGSVHGLEAAAGVTSALTLRPEHSVRWDCLPLVSGAIIYDYGVRGSTVHPDSRLGRAALAWTAAGTCPQGRVGAGIAASVGKALDPARAEWGGQGAAFRTVGATRIFVLTVVNAMGVVVGRDGTVVAGNAHPGSGVRRLLTVDLEDRLRQGVEPPGSATGSTTLTTLVTNHRLAPESLRQLARSVHSSMSRAIQPFHTQNDGDILFALTTDDVDDDPLDELSLGMLAAELAWDAVLSAVRDAAPVRPA